MIITDPVPWSYVPVGAQVLLHGVPRTVLINAPLYPNSPDDSRVVLVEGIVSPPTISGLSTVQLVIMDEADAVANLQAAALTATPITEE
jgi:hypothetical protein